MVLQTVAGNTVAEDADDLQAWLRGLAGCPQVTHTMLTACDNPTHDESDKQTWFYVEGDPRHGVARRRCLACAVVKPMLDSDEHWTFPPMWMCGSCGQSIAQIGIGAHAEPTADGPRVTWIVAGLRCVQCGSVDGLTDMLVPHLSLGDVARRI
jgi:hypothetical protein